MVFGGYSSGYHPADPNQSVPQDQLGHGFSSPASVGPVPVQPQAFIQLQTPGSNSALPQHRPTRGRTVSLWVFTGFIVLFVMLSGYFLGAIGAVASMVGLALAMIPLALVLVGIHLLDRWEPEPRSVKFFALGWGALAATSLTLIGGVAISAVIGVQTEPITSVLIAPVMEEFWKGLGVVVVFAIARRSFDGPIDGAVYGGLVGAGFAFTENAQYFAVSLLEGGGADLTVTFLMRALLSPFAHVMFTMLTGVAMGFAVRRGKSSVAVVLAGFAGFVSAVALHAFWNASALYADFFGLYLTLQVPLFVTFILGALWLQREEARFAQQMLSPYITAGWLTHEEVLMLATPGGRAAGLRWAATLRQDRRPVMRLLMSDAVQLAHVRARIGTSPSPQNLADEQILLQRMSTHRAQLLAW